MKQNEQITKIGGNKTDANKKTDVCSKADVCSETDVYKNKEILDSLEYVDPKFIEEAELGMEGAGLADKANDFGEAGVAGNAHGSGEAGGAGSGLRFGKNAGNGKKISTVGGRRGFLRWGAVAACVCLVLTGTVLGPLRNQQSTENPIQTWNENYTAAQYFTHSEVKDSSSANGTTGDSKGSDGDGEVMVISDNMMPADSILPWATSASFTDLRKELEGNKQLPVLPDYPLFNATVNYREDGSIYSVILHWGKQNADGSYSYINITAGQEEVPDISDCVAIEVDEDGNVITIATTVTERDGVQIIAKGGETQEKSITFQNETGWYRIEGSYNVSYEEVVAAYEWYWAHPIDFASYAMENGETVTNICLTDVEEIDNTMATLPETFTQLLPDFDGCGLLPSEVNITLNGDDPVHYEGHYDDGESLVHWCVLTNPTVYEQEECIGSLESITEEQVMSLTPVDEVTTETKVQFSQGDAVVVVYTNDLAKTWELIEGLKGR